MEARAPCCAFAVCLLLPPGKVAASAAAAFSRLNKRQFEWHVAFELQLGPPMAEDWMVVALGPAASPPAQGSRIRTVTECRARASCVGAGETELT